MIQELTSNTDNSLFHAIQQPEGTCFYCWGGNPSLLIDGKQWHSNCLESHLRVRAWDSGELDLKLERWSNAALTDPDGPITPTERRFYEAVHTAILQRVPITLMELTKKISCSYCTVQKVKNSLVHKGYISYHPLCRTYQKYDLLRPLDDSIE